MANIFSRSNDVNNKVPRNVFDGSFQNNLTMDIGGLYPVFCKEVIPGDSFKIQTTFGLRFLPLVFPIQTRLKANLHFFYVRNRNLWKDWMRYITNADGAMTDPSASAPIPPKVKIVSDDQYSKMMTTGSLGDYLGLPTTVNAPYGTTRDYIEYSYFWTDPSRSKDVLGANLSNEDVFNFDSFRKSYERSLSTEAGMPLCYSRASYQAIADSGYWKTDNVIPSAYLSWCQASVNLAEEVIDDGDCRLQFVLRKDYWGPLADRLSVSYEFLVQYVVSCCILCPIDEQGTLVHSRGVLASDIISINGYARYELIKFNGQSNDVAIIHIPSERFRVHFYECYGFAVYFPWAYNMILANEFGLPVADVDSPPILSTLNRTPEFGDFDGFTPRPTIYMSHIDYDYGSEYLEDIPRESNVLAGQLQPSALPFRAYEAIYNSFYRDVRNNPYILDGKPEYNKYIPTDEGGDDTTTYELRYRNWEPDFLTTAVQSPQQGIAPLVGVSSTGTMKFADENGNVYTAQAQFADDGETITSFSVNSPDMPVGNLRALVDIASSGISINDLRNVNALQRYLETNMRKGLRYKDWVKGHFDVDTSYAELDMPEFLGGVSQPVMVNQVTATASTSTDVLGDYAGQASCMGSGNTISRYFDEHGFVIGILSISPVPNYSQLLPKFWLKDNPLDYYTPEFGHIGYQPITYKEVCPLQSPSYAALNDVFGYQRAWYDYIANTDEVHGEFRTTMQDFLINRYFSERPELSEKFLLINPEDTNRPFVYTDKKNKPILGQIYFDLKMKRPIPELGIPRLE